MVAYRVIAAGDVMDVHWPYRHGGRYGDECGEAAEPEVGAPDDTR